MAGFLRLLKFALGGVLSLVAIFVKFWPPAAMEQGDIAYGN